MKLSAHAALPAGPAVSKRAPRVPQRVAAVPEAPRASPSPAQHGGCACGGICPRCAGTRNSPRENTAAKPQPEIHGRGEGESDEAPAIGAPPVAGPGTAVPAQAAPPPPPPAVASVRPNIGSSGTTLAHVPPCGSQPTIRFTAGPAAAAPITWTLAAGTAAVAAGTPPAPGATAVAGTTLAPPPPAAGATPSPADSLVADLTLGAAQTGGTLEVAATNSLGGGMTITYPLASHPTGITSTSVIGNPVAATDYGGVFDHEFTSNDGMAASLNNVAVGERFPNLPNPTTATHTFPTPFGDFTLSTGTLPDAASAGNGNWFLTNAGQLGGSHDNVTISKSQIDIGRHLVSDSNPTPANPLPAGFTVDQEFHWWCPHAAAGSRWTQFVPTTHERTLRMDASGTDAEFVAIVNGEENAIPYEGRTGVTNAVADTPTVAPSVAGGTANTVQISADKFPSSRGVHFSIRGAALGCTINAATGVLTIGRQTGTVTVRVANANGGPNWDEVQVTIANPQPAPPPPTPAPQPNPNPNPGGTTAPPVGEATPPPVS